MLRIYDWIEFGEGGIVAPTRADGAMKLETIFRGVAGQRNFKVAVKKTAWALKLLAPPLLGSS
jgi:hypothetical protein